MGCNVITHKRIRHETIDSSLHHNIPLPVEISLSPAHAIAYQQLQALYDQDKPFIPKKIEPYYRYVLNKTHTAVTEVTIKVANLELQGMQYLCKILPFYGGIGELRLWKVGVDVQSAVALADQLSYLANLQRLALEDDSLGDEALQGLISGFKDLKVLRELLLSCNHISPIGCESLSIALPSLPFLESLNLDYNELESKGCRTLCSRLLAFHPLQFLSLEANSIDGNAIEALTGLGTGNPPVQMTNLKGNRLNEEQVKVLQEQFPKGKVELALQIVTIFK